MTNSVNFLPPALQRRLGLALVVGIFLLLFGFGSLPASGHLVDPPWDKVVHCGVFAALAVGLRSLWPRLPWLLVIVLVVGVGAADEWHQMFVPTRQPDWDDGLADLCGAVVGLLAWRWSGLRRLFGAA